MKRLRGQENKKSDIHTEGGGEGEEEEEEEEEDKRRGGEIRGREGR